MQLGVLNNRQFMLQTYSVREPPQGKAGIKEVAEFPGAVQSGGVVIDMHMGMGPVRVGHHKKSVAALGPAHRQLIANIQSLLWGEFPRRKGLPDLIAKHIRIPLLLPARNGLIHGLGKQKLRVAVMGSHS